MNMAKAYDDYLQSRSAGWNRAEALEHACFCWDVQQADLEQYIATFGDYL